VEQNVTRGPPGDVVPGGKLERHWDVERIGGDGISIQGCSVMGFLVTHSAADEFVALGQSQLVTA
jgi:hypothetical protein